MRAGRALGEMGAVRGRLTARVPSRFERREQPLGEVVVLPAPPRVRHRVDRALPGEDVAEHREPLAGDVSRPRPGVRTGVGGDAALGGRDDDLAKGKPRVRRREPDENLLRVRRLAERGHRERAEGGVGERLGGERRDPALEERAVAAHPDRVGGDADPEPLVFRRNPDYGVRHLLRFLVIRAGGGRGGRRRAVSPPPRRASRRWREAAASPPTSSAPCGGSRDRGAPSRGAR